MFSRRGPQPLFKNRHDAGQQLAPKVRQSIHAKDTLVLGLPRGGVPVAFEVAKALPAELDVFIVRKLGVPGQEELAFGAVASAGIRVLNEDLLRKVQLSTTVIEQITARERIEVGRREEFYRGKRPPARMSGRTVILVDDGLATGASMKAACAAVREQRPQQLVVAVPVAARETCRELAESVDLVLCLATPPRFEAVGSWYEDFSQTSEQEVQLLLAQHSA